MFSLSWLPVPSLVFPAALPTSPSRSPKKKMKWVYLSSSSIMILFWKERTNLIRQVLFKQDDNERLDAYRDSPVTNPTLCWYDGNSSARIVGGNWHEDEQRHRDWWRNLSPLLDDDVDEDDANGKEKWIDSNGTNKLSKLGDRHRLSPRPDRSASVRESLEWQMPSFDSCSTKVVEGNDGENDAFVVVDESNSSHEIRWRSQSMADD